jgi:integrase
MYAVGGVPGLMMRVSDTGARYWILRTTVAGRRRDIGIGAFPEVSLAAARRLAADKRQQVREGIDPLAERHSAKLASRAAQAKALSFNECAERFIQAKSREFRNAKHVAQWRSTLTSYAGPVIGALPVERVELAHILQILQPIWDTKTETATRLRARIERVLDYATVSGYRTGDNPARWQGKLNAILPQPSKLKRVRHHRAVPWADAPAFLTNLRQRKGIAARGVEFLLYTAARSGEVRGARWEEIDLEMGIWTVPGQRMKAGRSHRVPLSTPAVTLLRDLPRFGGCPYVFPSPRGGILSDMTLAAVMRRMQIDATVHGLRSTFRDWCSEVTGHPKEVAEMALAHVIENQTELAYRRGDLFAKRAQLMTDWAQFLFGGTHDISSS